MVRWEKEGIEPVKVSVNFSRKDLADKQLADNINTIIEESGIDRKLIEIEVTETTDEEEQGALSEFISRLYSFGITTAIDDFGAGYSSIVSLRDFRVKTLKIDRSFINTDDFSWKDEVILKDIIHMAQELGMDIITEGVERQDQGIRAGSVSTPDRSGRNLRIGPITGHPWEDDRWCRAGIQSFHQRQDPLIVVTRSTPYFFPGLFPLLEIQTYQVFGPAKRHCDGVLQDKPLAGPGEILVNIGTIRGVLVSQVPDGIMMAGIFHQHLGDPFQHSDTAIIHDSVKSFRQGIAHSRGIDIQDTILGEPIYLRTGRTEGLVPLRIYDQILRDSVQMERDAFV